jgi:hypothetical protein
MMQIVKLTTREQLESLKKGDKLIVQWAFNPNSGRKFNEITMTEIWGINHIHEVIVRAKDNLYFSIGTFLEGKSFAREVYLVKGDGDENTAD